ncbi:RNA polymerase sigma factor [Paenibacillus rhizoplanae]
MQPLPAEDEGRQDSAGQAAVTRSAEMEYLGDRQVHEIWRLIMSLPDKLREVLVLDLKAELSVREIAELIRISPGTVKSRLHRARHKNPGQTEGDGVMDKREREPQWYELARKGPFPEIKFTEEAAGRVVRQIGIDGSSLNQVLPYGQRRRVIRIRMLSTAVVLLLLLLGAGALVLGSDGVGRSGGFNPLEVSGAGMIEPPTAGQVDLSDAGLKRTAVQVMQEQLGKKVPLCRCGAPEGRGE